jgi:hypothetical protein
MPTQRELRDLLLGVIARFRALTTFICEVFVRVTSYLYIMKKSKKTNNYRAKRLTQSGHNVSELLKLSLSHIIGTD